MKGFGKALGLIFCFCVMCLFVVGCGMSENDNSYNDVSGIENDEVVAANEITLWNAANLPEFKLLPEPEDGEPSAILQIPEQNDARLKAVSSNDFYDILKADVFNEEGGEIRIDFYTGDEFNHYEGGWYIPAGEFYGYIKAIKADVEYKMVASTFNPISYNCFHAETVLFISSAWENKIYFNFQPTGYVVIPCYIADAGIYSSGSYYISDLKGDYSSYIWENCKYNEYKELQFKISYSYSSLANLGPKDLELHVTSEDGLHIFQFEFNPLDIINHSRPLKLIAEELAVSNVGMGGGFEYEDKEIIINNLNNGDVIGFPLQVLGSTHGIDKIEITISKGIDVIAEYVMELADTDGDGIFSFGSQYDSIDGLNSGDEFTVAIAEYRDSVENDLLINSININLVYFPYIRIDFPEEYEKIWMPYFPLQGTGAQNELLQITMKDNDGVVLWDAPTLINENGEYDVPIPLSGFVELASMVLIEVKYENWSDVQSASVVVEYVDLEGKWITLSGSEKAKIFYIKEGYRYPLENHGLFYHNHAEKVLASWGARENEVIEVSLNKLTSFPFPGCATTPNFSITLRPGTLVVSGIDAEKSYYSVGPGKILCEISVDKWYEMYGDDSIEKILYIDEEILNMYYVKGCFVEELYPYGTVLRHDGKPYVIMGGKKCGFDNNVAWQEFHFCRQCIIEVSYKVIDSYEDGNVIIDMDIPCLTDPTQPASCNEEYCSDSDCE